MNNKTLIRGESLSINVKLDYDGIPFSEIDHGEIIANAWFQNNVKVPLIVTQLEGDGEYNLYSDIDTRKLKGESFLVNIVVNRIEGDAPENLIMATFNQTFYIVNSATDMDNRPLLAGGHSVVYLVDGEYYACESYPEGASIVPVSAPTREGYVFGGWTGLPSFMPSHCVVAKGSYYISPEVPYSDGLEYIDIDDETCALNGIGTNNDLILRIPPVHDGKTVVAVADLAFYKSNYMGDPPKYLQSHNYETVIFPDTIKKIGNWAFRNRPNLKLIYLPSYLEEIGDYAFSGVGGTGGGGTISDCILYSGILPSTLYKIGKGAFSFIANTSITIPNGLTNLKLATFSNCQFLSELILPYGLLVIEGCDPVYGTTDLPVFGGTPELEEIIIPETVVEIQNAIIATRYYQENKTLNFLGDAPIISPYAFGWSDTGYHTYRESACIITIKYDSRKNGWSSKIGNNFGAANVIWIDKSQQGG